MRARVRIAPSVGTKPIDDSPRSVVTRIDPAVVPVGMTVVMRVSVTERTSPWTGPDALGKRTRLFAGMIQSKPRPTSWNSAPGMGVTGLNDPTEGELELPDAWRVRLEDPLLVRLKDWLTPDNVRVIY